MTTQHRLLALETVAVAMAVVLLLRVESDLQLPFAMITVLWSALSYFQGLHSGKNSTANEVATAPVKVKKDMPTHSEKNKSGAFEKRHSVHAWSIRVADGSPELLEVFVSRRGQMWSIWKSMDEIFSLRKKLIQSHVGMSIPLLPIHSNPVAATSVTGSDNDEEWKIIRNDTPISGWLQSITMDPMLCDSPELAIFLGDHSKCGAPPIELLCDAMLLRYPFSVDPAPGYTDTLSGDSKDRAFQGALTISSPSVAGTSKYKRFKSAAKSLFRKKSSSKDDVGLEANLGELDGERSNSNEIYGILFEEKLLPKSPVAPTESYSVWLEKQQQILGFCGDTFESFEYTDICEEARDLFKDTGSTNGFHVRGPNYLKDKKKIPAGLPLCRLLSMEIFSVEDGDTHFHVATRGVVKRHVDAALALKDPPFLFIINFQLPGDPDLSFVTVHALPPELSKNFNTISNVPVCYMDGDMLSGNTKNIDASTAAGLKLLERFADFPTSEADRLASLGLSEESDGSGSGKPRKAASSGWGFGSDITWEDPREPGIYPPSDFKNQRFKLGCRILEGPWMVRTAVPSVPVLLGQKVVLRYFRGNGYVETDIQIASSSIALRTVGTVRSYAKYFVDEIGVWLQGESEEELPEKLISILSMVKPDCDVHRRLD